MRKFSLVIAAAAASTALSGLGAGSAAATITSPDRHADYHAVGGNCADMYQKAIALCDLNYKSNDQRAQCYKWAQADYKKCMSSR